MKHQSSDAIPVTKTVLNEALGNYPTKQDLKAALKEYPTKDELDMRLDKSFAAFRQGNAYQFKLMREELYDVMSTFTNRILTAIDPLMKDLEVLQKRVTKLEHASMI